MLENREERDEERLFLMIVDIAFNFISHFFCGVGS